MACAGTGGTSGTIRGRIGYICTRIQFRRYGGWGWDHLLTNIVPRLRYAGVSQQELDAMFIDTPRCLLTLPG